MTNYAIGKSHAKIILIGEHSAVYNQPAIVLPLFNLNIVVTISTISNGKIIHSRYYNGDLSKAPRNLAGIKMLIYRLLKKFKKTQATFDLKIKSKIPSECGMGSSAASAIAITRALHHYFKKPLNRELLLNESNIEESITHGNPSGMDAAAASSNTPIWFIKNQMLKRIPFNIHGSLIIAYTGIQSETNQAVNLVHKHLNNNPKPIKTAMKELGELALTTKTALKNGAILKIGQNMNLAQKQLSILGVSVPKIDRLIQVGRDAGALGAKLTGSGLGGCVIFIANKKDTAHIKQALIFAGANQTWVQDF